MELLGNLAFGLATAMQPSNLMFCFTGALIGTLVGVLPGLGPMTTVALLLPFTFGLTPEAALIMLAGIFYGAQYGGSTTAILVNMPGETSSVVTCLDGYQLARKGRAGPALAMAAIASFFAGTVATLVIALLSGPMAALALKFTAAEYFSLLIVGLIAAVVLAHGSAVKAVAMIVIGVLLGLVGIDVNSGVPRMTFGLPELADGIGFVPVVMGLFGLAEIASNLEKPQDRTLLTQKITGLMPTGRDLRQGFPAMLRGTVLGSLLGVLPGGGAALPPFAAYALEKRVARDPSRFGKGAIEGVAGPEAANNAGAQTSFIPMLTLGIPSNPLMALMIGALMIQGIQPGPQIMTEQPALFWGVVASMWTGNLMLLVINLPLIGLWVSMLKIPYRMLFPAIILFCCIGAYSVNNSVFDIWVMLGSALIGYFFIKVGVEPAPLVLGFVLGPMLEENFRRAMMIADGDLAVFVTRPISAALLAVAVALLVALVSPSLRRKREVAFAE
ncbi:tripartite tricarboxylate transporter permease [Azospirillum sp. SYSU D00513]|uniref:tripartite tricarboxylate transporter permease n=1 Tax=Azospirillum sp. SYSU D00513 TaxID=2812561 RepID=UPI001A9733A8|nr:tripartite tricarboxylate transporter permease [Azospirillum sp. SYSU D00513]